MGQGHDTTHRPTGGSAGQPDERESKQHSGPEPHPELSRLSLPANDRGGGLCGRFQAHSPGAGLPQGLSP